MFRNIEQLFTSSDPLAELERLMSFAAAPRRSGGFPPYDVVSDGQSGYALRMALAGYGPDDVEITLSDDILTVASNKIEEKEVQFLHRGIAKRAFRTSFEIGAGVEVGAASMDNGVLTVPLTIAEVAPKSRKVEIKKAA
jgi:molecular chaperone IbpA